MEWVADGIRPAINKRCTERNNTVDQTGNVYMGVKQKHLRATTHTHALIHAHTHVHTYTNIHTR